MYVQTWVDCASDDPTKRIPGAIIEPVVELVEALLCQEAGGAVVEVGIELVNNALKAEHREETSGERCKEKPYIMLMNYSFMNMHCIEVYKYGYN